jgi:uncharacterized membrane protein/glutaredoxin
MISVNMYSRSECHLCEQAKEHLAELQLEYPHELVEIDIDNDPALVSKYGVEIPVVEIGPYQLKAPFSRQDLQVALGAAQDRARQLESFESPDFRARLFQGMKLTKADRFSHWLARHYMAVFNVFVLIYAGLPFLAPVLMVSGFELPARLIYRLYGAMCHQLAYRSWFLFGEQPFYPRAAAGVEGVIPFGEASGIDEFDQWTAREFIGNPVMGYKVALCERDVAIYGGILLFGLVYSATGRRLRAIPWYVWILLGILPIAVDGLSQLFSQPPFDNLPLFSLLVYRESTPFLRTLTGFLFGCMTAWFGYPMVEESMLDTRKYMDEKNYYLNKNRAQMKS